MDYSDDEWVTSERIEPPRRSTTPAANIASKVVEDKNTIQAAAEFITPEELDRFCRAMDSKDLVQRLAKVYKNAEAYLKIREIETSKLTIEVRLCEQLHNCPDPGMFILDVIREISRYFDQPIKNKCTTLTAKFRRYLVQAACRSLELFFSTPPKDYKRPSHQEEKDLISFAEADEEESNLISFDDDVPASNTGQTQVEEEIEEEETTTTTTEDDDDDDDEGEVVASISLIQLLNIPPEVAQRYQLRREHQIDCIRLLDEIEAPILIYYAMDVYQLEPLLRNGGEFENDGAKFCRMLLQHGHYNEAISCIRKLDLFHAFPLEKFAEQLFNLGQEKITAVYVSGKEQLQRRLLRYINLQLRFTFAGKLGIVSPENLEISEEDAQIQPVLRLRERKFQKDLATTASKVIQELNIPSKEYYFIWLSQRYSCLRWIILERGTQQNEERDLSIAGTSNYNGLIDLVAGEDPALAKLAIKEFVDMGDPYAPAYFATRLGQQEFFVFYSSRPSQERFVGVIKGESMTRHRSCLSPRKSSPHPQLSYYTLPYHAQPIMVDNQDMVLQMQYILNQYQICGLDSEWVPQFAKNTNLRTSLLQIAIENGTIFLVDIKTAFDPSNAALLHLMDKTLRQLFEAEHIVKLAYDFDGDFSMLKGCMPTAKKWKLNNLVDFKGIRVTSNNKNGKKSGTTPVRGLAGVVSAFLGVTMNKKQQISNWDQRPLTLEQANYAAGDAYCLLQVYAALQEARHPFLTAVKNAPEIQLTEPAEVAQSNAYQYSSTPPPPYVEGGTTYYPSSFSPYNPTGMPQF